MTPAQVHRAQQLLGDRDRLLNLVAAAEIGSLSVSIAGRYLEDECVQAARPAVAAVYHARVTAIDAELATLGIAADA